MASGIPYDDNTGGSNGSNGPSSPNGPGGSGGDGPSQRTRLAILIGVVLIGAVIFVAAIVIFARSMSSDGKGGSGSDGTDGTDAAATPSAHATTTRDPNDVDPSAGAKSTTGGLPTLGPTTLTDPILIRPVILAKPGACPPGGSWVPSSDGLICYTLADKGIDVHRVQGLSAQGPGTNQPGFSLLLTLESSDAKAFAAITERLSKAADPPTARPTSGPGSGSSPLPESNQLAMVVGGKVLTAPRVMGRIPGPGVVISGNFDRNAVEGYVKGLTSR